MGFSENIDTILNLSAEKYPNLARLKEGRCKVADHLVGLMRYMDQFDFPAWNGYCIFSVEQLRDNAKLMDPPVHGSLLSWQSHIVLLDDLGLIRRIRATELSFDSEFLKRLYLKAKAKGKKPPTLWAVPDYTPELLEEAEHRMAAYVEKGVNLTYITKDVFIRVYGQEAANSMYLDGRTISRNTAYVWDVMVKTVQRCVKKKGFGLKDDIVRKAKRTIWRNLKACKADKCLCSYLAGCIGQKNFTEVVKAAGYDYHRVRADELEVTGFSDRRRWVVGKLPEADESV